MNMIEYLPAIYQDPSDGDQEPDRFLAEYLSAFERVLLEQPGEPLVTFDPRRSASQPAEAGEHRTSDGSGRGEDWSQDPGAAGNYHFRDDVSSLEGEINSLFRLFDPQRTPERFLSWLAGWVALTLRKDIDVARQRRVVANIARLYRIRGTRLYLEELLKLYVDALPSVTDEDAPAFQIKDHSNVGVDTYLGGGPSFMFRVTLAFSHNDSEEVERQRRLAREITDMERPAHTQYEVKAIFPRFRVGFHSTVGVDTILAP